MLPVIAAFLAFMAALFRSRTSLHLEHRALRNQRGLQAVGTATAPPYHQSSVLGMAVSAVVRVAKPPGVRPADYRH
jgi:hypothetical protein